MFEITQIEFVAIHSLTIVIHKEIQSGIILKAY